MAPVPEFYNLVTGERMKPLSCEEARRISIFCGKGGEWFESKEKSISPGQIVPAKIVNGKVQVIAGRGDREVKR
jgi:hypothetical protein